MKSNRFQSKEIKEYFDRSCQAFGNTVAAVGWYNRGTQETRFQQLCEIGNLNNNSILDIGCGLADLYHYLCKTNIINFKYAGVDISEKMVQTALENIPGVNIEVKDLFNSEYTNKYDFVFCSGALNFYVANKWEYIRTAIKKMFSICNKGVAFNLLSAYAPYEHKENGQETFHYYYPEDILAICFELTKKVTLKHSYLPNDFTIYMYKNSL